MQLQEVELVGILLKMVEEGVSIEDEDLSSEAEVIIEEGVISEEATEGGTTEEGEAGTIVAEEAEDFMEGLNPIISKLLHQWQGIREKMMKREMINFKMRVITAMDRKGMKKKMTTGKNPSIKKEKIFKDSLTKRENIRKIEMKERTLKINN